MRAPATAGDGPPSSPLRGDERPRWGRETERAQTVGSVSGHLVPLELIHVLGHVKAAAAAVSGRDPRIGAVDAEVGAAIERAAGEVAAGRWDRHFPLDVLQTGSGTATNMNVNEVVADRAEELVGRAVHPNDQVNACQSSNDVVPTAIRLLAALRLRDGVLPALDRLAATLRERAVEHARTVAVGRTHLMDAAPVFLGDVIAGWAAQVEGQRPHLERAMIAATAVPLGGSAVGTGLNVPPGWAEAVVRDLARRTGAPVRLSSDRFAAQSGGEVYATVSGELRNVAVALAKVADDLRWLASGPATAIGEVELPVLAAGSSIMPGKVNPVVPEIVLQATARVQGNDVTVGIAAAGGHFQLNTFQPLCAAVLDESLRLVERSADLLAERCVAGLTVDVARARRHAEASSAVITGLAVHLGYDRATELVQAARTRDVPVAQVVAEAGVDPELAGRLLDVERLAEGGRG